jgi:hypothetical protein
MSYKELAQEFFYWGAGEEAIKNALTREGFDMRAAICKLPISEKNRRLRLEFAKAYRGWIYHNWRKFLWSDETWVTHGRHRKTRFTARWRGVARKLCRGEAIKEEMMDVLGVISRSRHISEVRDTSSSSVSMRY